MPRTDRPRSVHQPAWKSARCQPYTIACALWISRHMPNVPTCVQSTNCSMLWIRLCTTPSRPHNELRDTAAGTCWTSSLKLPSGACSFISWPSASRAGPDCAPIAAIPDLCLAAMQPVHAPGSNQLRRCQAHVPAVQLQGTCLGLQQWEFARPAAPSSTALPLT